MCTVFVETIMPVMASYCRRHMYNRPAWVSGYLAYVGMTYTYYATRVKINKYLNKLNVWFIG